MSRQKPKKKNLKEGRREWQKHEIVLNSGITAMLVRGVLRLGKSRQKVMFYEKSAKRALDLKEQKLKKEGMNACNPRRQKGGTADDSEVCWKNGAGKEDKEEVKSNIIRQWHLLADKVCWYLPFTIFFLIFVIVFKCSYPDWLDIAPNHWIFMGMLKYFADQG